MANIVLLLTACVNPNGMASTALQDTNVRLSQYEESLTWYLNNTDYRIVFVENTNYDISGDFLSYIDSGRLECITFNGNNYDKNLGKGYGEALLVDYAFSKSQIIRTATSIVKITGRLIIKNINHLIPSKPLDNCIYVDIDVPLSYAMSYFFMAPREFFTDYFLVNKEKINDSAPNRMHFEKILADACRLWKKEHKLRTFWYEIHICGISGTKGSPYAKPSCYSRIRKFVKAFIMNVIKS